MKPYVFHPAANAEYAEAAAYYSGIDAQLGVRFYEEIERLISELRQDPERFWQFDPPARRHLSDVFPYSVVYLDQPEHIWIVAIMHGHREPGYWHKRVS